MLVVTTPALDGRRITRYIGSGMLMVSASGTAVVVE
jgi:uncharacterized protein YbjQ (UPF0145 family)